MLIRNLIGQNCFHNKYISTYKQIKYKRIMTIKMLKIQHLRSEKGETYFITRKYIKKYEQFM